MERFFGKWNRWVLVGIVLVVAVLLPLMTSDPWFLSLVITALVWAVATMGFAAIARTGSFSLGQAAFMAIGAYTACLLQKNIGLSFWPGLLIAGLCAALFAAVVGVIVLRISGFYFAIITLAFNEVVRLIVTNWRGLTEGLRGIIPSAPSPIHIGSLTIDFVASKVPYYYLILIIAIVVALVFWRLESSRFGRVSRAIATNELLSQHIGIHPMKYRVIIFTIAGFFSGVVGAYYVFFTLFLNPTIFNVWKSVDFVIMGAIGGVSSAVAGPIIGALIVSAGGTYLSSVFLGLQTLVYGSIVIAILLFLPGGVVQLRKYFAKLFERWSLNAARSPEGP
jgi:branched-chain amino acid transport system permease protein